MARITLIKPHRGEILVARGFNPGKKRNQMFSGRGRKPAKGKMLYRPERTKNKKGGITNCDTII
jgi:hypothetical protein